MRTSAVLTILLTTFALSSNSMFSQEYMFEQIVSGYGGILSSVADDFILNDPGTLEEIRIWCIFDGNPEFPEYMYFDILEDAGDISPRYATCIGSGGGVPEIVDTGDVTEVGGYHIYQVTLELYTSLALEEGPRYWLEVSIPNNPATWVLAKTHSFGSMLWVNTGAFWRTSEEYNDKRCDMFFELNPVDTALERDSWASIKTAF